MKTSHIFSVLALFLSGMFLVSCDTKQEDVRDQAIENKADALEGEADLTRKQGEAAADSVEDRADAAREAADQEAKRLEDAADSTRDQK
jgi:hypothetical protein